MTTLFALNCLVGVLLIVLVNSQRGDGFKACIEAVDNYGPYLGSLYILIAWSFLSVFWLPCLVYLMIKEVTK